MAPVYLLHVVFYWSSHNQPAVSAGQGCSYTYNMEEHGFFHSAQGSLETWKLRSVGFCPVIAMGQGFSLDPSQG